MKAGESKETRECQGRGDTASYSINMAATNRELPMPHVSASHRASRLHSPMRRAAMTCTRDTYHPSKKSLLIEGKTKRVRPPLRLPYQWRSKLGIARSPRDVKRFTLAMQICMSPPPSHPFAVERYQRQPKR